MGLSKIRCKLVEKTENFGEAQLIIFVSDQLDLLKTGHNKLFYFQETHAFD
jgi:hypothetical protein